MRLAAVSRLAVLAIALCTAMVTLPLGSASAARAVTDVCVSPNPAAQNSCLRFNYTGTHQAFVVPKGASSLSALLWGAGGGGNYNSNSGLLGSGAGGFTSGDIAVSAGDALNLTVGEGGAARGVGATFGGGGAPGSFTFAGSSQGGPGGGMSAVWLGPADQAANALLVAGGGGGAQASSGMLATGAGGGGGFVGGAGTNAAAGQGGTPTAGGAAGSTALCTADPGSQFAGGQGGSLSVASHGETGGGGGGGWFGGGGGGCQVGASPSEGGGGGGSAFIAPSIVNGVTEAGENGKVLSALPGGSTHVLWDSSLGIGRGAPGARTTGGNGQIVLLFDLPQPALDTPTNGTVTAEQRPVFSGTGTAGTTALVEDELGATVCSATVLGDGTWSCVPTADLPDGTASYTATAVDPASPDAVYPESEPVVVTIDTTPPTKPVITLPADGSATSDRNPAISGTGEPGASLVVRDQGGILCSATVQPGGDWDCVPTSQLALGSHTLTAVQTDPAGNVSPVSDPVELTIEAFTPGAPVITTPRDGSVVVTDHPRISGVGQVGATVDVKDRAGTLICEASVGADGTWTCVPSRALTAGENTLTAEQRNAAGKVSPMSAPVTVSVDVRPPIITSPQSRARIADARPLFVGTGSAGSTIAVTTQEGAVVCTAVVAADRTWSCEAASALALGPHTVHPVMTDESGNSVVGTSMTFTIVGTAPQPAVQPTKPWLAHTGAYDPAPFLAGGGGLLVLAAAIYLSARRSRRGEP